MHNDEIRYIDNGNQQKKYIIFKNVDGTETKILCKHKFKNFNYKLTNIHGQNIYVLEVADKKRINHYDWAFVIDTKNKTYFPHEVRLSCGEAYKCSLKWYKTKAGIFVDITYDNFDKHSLCFCDNTKIYEIATLSKCTRVGTYNGYDCIVANPNRIEDEFDEKLVLYAPAENKILLKFSGEEVYYTDISMLPDNKINVIPGNNNESYIFYKAKAGIPDYIHVNKTEWKHSSRFDSERNIFFKIDYIDDTSQLYYRFSRDKHSQIYPITFGKDSFVETDNIKSIETNTLIRYEVTINDKIYFVFSRNDGHDDYIIKQIALNKSIKFNRLDTYLITYEENNKKFFCNLGPYNLDIENDFIEYKYIFRIYKDYYVIALANGKYIMIEDGDPMYTEIDEFLDHIDFTTKFNQNGVVDYIKDLYMKDKNNGFVKVYKMLAKFGGLMSSKYILDK